MIRREAQMYDDRTANGFSLKYRAVLLLTFHSTMIKYPDSVVFEDKRKEYH